MTDGLPRKLRYAFVLQALVSTLVIVVGIWIAGSAGRAVLTSQSLQDEADSFWAARTRDPQYRLPTSSTVQGYFVAAGQSSAQLPAELRAFESGISRLAHQSVLVDVREPGRLYLVMSFKRLDSVIAWLGAVSMLLGLLAVYVLTWLTYRRSRRLVVPVNWLARQVSQWDPRDPDVRSIAADRIPGGGGSEVQQLSGALRDLSTRTHDFVQRERDFTRDASHELRTPLTVIRVATDMMLADEEIPARAQRTLARMQHACRDMEALIDAFLILAREAGNLPLAEDFVVADVVGDEVEKARPLLANKPVTLDLVVAAAPRLRASPRVLAVMLGQLLENACTFTEQGHIELRIEADRIVMRDTGIGMSEDTLQKAHDPFYRADPFNPSGKGMGLPIVRRLGDRLGWPVVLESTPGVGTTVTIHFAQHLIS